jgi:SAM-dependent methyltransferase
LFAASNLGIYQINLQKNHHPMKELKFTTDWTTNNTEIWREHLRPLIHKPGVRGLEVGTWEGRSTAWLLHNVITGTGATLTTIDHDHSRFAHNREILIEEYGAGRLNVITDDALRVLIHHAAMEYPKYDFIYLDAPKDAADVLAQTVLCWEVLKPKGILIFDDYMWPGKDDGGFPNPPRHYSNPPRIAIDAFLSLNYLRHTRLHQGWQVIVRKKGGA